MSNSTVPQVTRRWDLYGWAVVTVLMALFLFAAIIGLDAALPFLIVPALIIFLIVVLPLLFKWPVKKAT